jgi:chemotaxis methyl-accepting protein methylase
MFANFIDKFLNLYNETAMSQKKRIFAALTNLKSKDPALQKDNKIRVLEIGCGSGEYKFFHSATAYAVFF